MQDLKTWTCGHCPHTFLVPPQGSENHLDAMARIREHRFAHLTEALMHGSDEDLLGLCEDEPTEPMSESFARAVLAEPVDSDDVAPVLEGIGELLRADLPRARKMWYPINEDGSFNREENK